MTWSWTLSCRFCGVSFTSDRPVSYCSRRCYDRHKWFGNVPDQMRGRR